MVAAPCRRFRHAARWKGHAPHTTTGAVRTSDSDSKLCGTRRPGTIASIDIAILIDEPFTSVDVTIKLALIQEIKAIVHRLKIPTIYVTHYANEAFNMADKIMILHNGYVVENGTRDEIMLEPKVQFTKTLIQSLSF